MSGKVYLAMVRRVQRSRGKARRTLRKRAAKYRKKLIGRGRRSRGRRQVRRNRWHPADGAPKKKYGRLTGRMPQKYKELLHRVLRTKEGKKALAQYRRSSGLPFPTEIKILHIPKQKHRAFVGWGKSPAVHLTDGPKGRATRKKTFRKSGHLASDVTGKRLYVFYNRDARGSKKQKLRAIGYVPQTDYVPTDAEERAGTFKKGKYWVHSHSDEGGKWPLVYVDQAGNIVYGKSTYTAKGKWLRR